MSDRTNAPVGFNVIHEYQVNGKDTQPRREPAALTAALAYQRLGWSVIPLCPADHSGSLPPRHCATCSRPGKQPPYRWGQYQVKAASADQILAWWQINPAFNVGVVMGRVSGLVAFDVDGDSGEEELSRLFAGNVPLTLSFQSGRGGRRLFFKLPANSVSARPVLGLNKAKLDFLANGSQTVMPPSLHVSGRLYTWSHGWHESFPTIETATDDLLNRVNRARGNHSLPGGGARGPVMEVTDHTTQVARARADVLTWEPCVSGEAGQKQVFRYCCRLVHGYHLDVATAYALMTEGWNQACYPPWSQQELIHHLEGALKRGEHPTIEHRPQPGTGATTRPATTAATAGQRTAGGGANEGPHHPAGLVASQLQTRPVEWLLAPYVPRAMLSLVVGKPGSGKSTFVAHLVSKARRAVLLCGFEEDPCIMLKPRLEAHGVKMGDVFIVTTGAWYLPANRDSLFRVVRDWKADLVVADPIDSYLSDGSSENDAVHVREFLEAFASIASQTGAAVVGVRHPGKDPNNVLVGSRNWRAVPRSIIELVEDAGPPPSRLIRLYKDSLGQDALPRRFDLVGESGKPRVFTFGDSITPAEFELAKDVPDRMERLKIDQAEELLTRLLAGGELPVADVFKAGEAERLNEHVLRRAGQRLNLKHRREGKGREHKVFWFLPDDHWEGVEP